MSLGGKNTSWKHGTHGATSSLTDFTTKMRSVSMTLNGEEVDATTFGDTFRDYEQSFKNGTFTTQYKYDATVYGQLGSIFTNGDSVDFEYCPDGTATGNPKVTGSIVMTGFSDPTGIGDLKVVDVTWRINGAATFGTNS